MNNNYYNLIKKIKYWIDITVKEETGEELNLKLIERMQQLQALNILY